MKNLILIMLILFISGSCNSEKKSFLSQVNVQSNTEKKIDPEGYYYPTDSVRVNDKYVITTLLIIPVLDGSGFTSEFTFSDIDNGSELTIKSCLTKLSDDSLVVILKDNNLGNIELRLSFLDNPIDNPDVIEHETIVLKGSFVHNGVSKMISLTYFGGD